jgi:hypothetical protein
MAVGPAFQEFPGDPTLDAVNPSGVEALRGKESIQRFDRPSADQRQCAAKFVPDASERRWQSGSTTTASGPLGDVDDRAVEIEKQRVGVHACTAV